MLRSGYFDSEITGYDEEGMPIFDRAESSDFFALVLKALISDGVLGDTSDRFQVLAKEGMKLQIQPGVGFVQGRFAMDDEVAIIELEPAPTNYSRIDRIVLRANYIDRVCEIVKKTGVIDAAPVAPALLRPEPGNSGDFYELSLATIRVKSNQTVISNADITDTRMNSVECGIIHSLINKVSTETLFVQYTAWYQNITQQAENDLADWFTRFTDWFEPTKAEFEEAIQNANDKATLANTAAVRLNDFITDMEAQIAAGRFDGSQGAQGIQGEKGDKGDKGDRGDSGIVVPASGLFTLSGDENGDLWAFYAEGSNPPSFDHNEETGEIFYITPEE
ncbi:MAG: hypothetical protein HFF79_08110 [Oscillospiraceae bacterium]|nr:hypothetical protein [Oscillospiraceae bacterium]